MFAGEVEARTEPLRGGHVELAASPHGAEQSYSRCFNYYSLARRCPVAQRTVITLVDDLDHKEIETDGQTIRFAYQDIQYEIDLSEKHARSSILPWPHSWPPRVE
jgi:hypothetical protein